MELLFFLVKCLVILASVLLMAAPIVFEYFSFQKDKEDRISYKRLRILLCAIGYFWLVTLVLYLFKEIGLWLETLSFVQWIVQKLALSTRTVYCSQVIGAVLVNFAVGALYVFLSRFAKIGLKKKNLTDPQGKNGEFDFKQKFERKAIRFFHTETWFFVASILKYLNIVLSSVYALIFIIYQIPAFFGAKWIPYETISDLFKSGYIYPVITLLALWEIYLFLEGIKMVEKECPEILTDKPVITMKPVIDLNEIDEEVRKQFSGYYACDVDLSRGIQEGISSQEHHPVTEFIARAVENDKRNPQKKKEAYLDCLDKLVESEKSMLINGSFFSEFSMYFLRYLSAVIARGDNVVFVCNSDSQIDSVYDYLNRGLSEMSSLYCKNFSSEAVDFDEPIWRIIKISGEHGVIEEASVDENNILVTSLSYLCSSRFENQHSNFITLIDTVVFVDTLKTVNTFNRQLSILNTRLRHVTKNNSIAAKNKDANDMFKVRYMSREIRYICFDDSRIPELDKILRNMLSVDFDSVDSMVYSPATIVRCYNFDVRPDENGNIDCPQLLNSEEEIGTIMNMAFLCLSKGASTVTVFADDIIPYGNIAESVSANMGQISVKVDAGNIRFNRQMYNPDNYSVIIAVDSGENLPATIRKYVSMVSDKPSLVIVFSKPYMLRDYFTENINELWSVNQFERIPVEEGTKKDVAQKILVKANAGGITKTEILHLAKSVPQFEKYVDSSDVNAVLRDVLEVYNVSQEERINLFNYFEYRSCRDFNEIGKFCPEDIIFLRRKGNLFEKINGRDMVVMSSNEGEKVLPVPRSRMTQNFIAGQNFVHNGLVYHINKIDTAEGKLYVKLASGSKMNYKYVQAREYKVEIGSEPEFIFPTKHVMLSRESGEINVSDVFVSAFRAPMEVLTKGYFEIPSDSLSANTCGDNYNSISDDGNDERAKQTYRRYGEVKTPTYLSDSIIKETDLNAYKNGAAMMSLRLVGRFGPDIDKTLSLASVMLNELLHSMFPSVADSISVCPILHSGFDDKESEKVLLLQPKVSVKCECDLINQTDFEILIIEDCATDLGVISALMSSGDDLMNTLFAPLFRYLKWYSTSEKKSEYLYYGLDHEPGCFDFSSLYKISELFGGNKRNLKFVDIGSIVEYENCDFCGKRYIKGNNVGVLEDGRRMCTGCASNLVGNNKKELKAYVDRARNFIESTYGVSVGDDYEFLFETTVKIANTIKQNRNLQSRGSDIPLYGYIDEKKNVHVECSVPPASLSELVIRELTYIWQLKNLPDVDEELAEGQIALVAVQYLRFLNYSDLVSARTSYYENNSNKSGKGYRRLVRELMVNPQFNNNPFVCLLKRTGETVEDKIIPPVSKTGEMTDFGLSYTSSVSDRVFEGKAELFCRSRLGKSEQEVYDLLSQAIENHTDKVNVVGCGFDTVNKISEAIEHDRPDLFWFRTFSMCGDEVTLKYGATAEEAQELIRRMEPVAEQYLEGIDDSMSAYDVLLRIHVKLISQVDYDTIALEKQKKSGGPAKDKIDYLRTICGVFLDGKAVCEGYARAVQYLAQKCGIECAEASGYIRKENGEKSGAHAWNIVKVDGDYYYLDTTWDDSSNTVQTVKKNDLGFDYFCITTEELLRTRDLELCPVEPPECTSTKANYYNHNDLVIDSYDVEKLREIAVTAAKNGKKSFTFKCKSKALFDKALNQICADGKDCYDILKTVSKADKNILPNGYSYRYGRDLHTITVKFKYK